MDEDDLKQDFRSVWNRFWYYFNFSCQLPSWLPLLCSLINGIQLFSILFGWLKYSNNAFIQSLYAISDFFAYLSFSKISYTIIFIFIFAITLVFMLFIGLKYKLLILNSVYVFILHFLLDIILPIIAPKLFYTIGKGIEEYLNSELSFYFILLNLFSFVFLLLVFTLKTISQSRTMIMTTVFTQSWNLWVDYFKILIVSIIPAVKFIKNESLMNNTYYCSCILYSLIFINFDSNQAYVHPLMNILFITIDVSLFILSIINIEFNYIFTNDDSIHLIVTIFVLLISFFFSISYYNHQSLKYQQMIDNEKDAQTFSESLFDDPNSVSILRQQSIYDPQRATIFAEHLLTGTSDPFIYTESIRFLVLLHCVKEEVFDKIMKTNPNEYSYLYRQLIYDARNFVVTMDVSSSTIEPFLTELNTIYLKIELLLIALSEEIQLKNIERAIGLLSLYSNACELFEGCALNAFRHSPNSPQLAELLRQYYLNLRGDYIQSQVWSHRENATDSSTTVSFHSYSSFRVPFSVYGSRALNSNNLSKSKDPTTHNKLKSQEAIEKVKSKACLKAMISFAVFSVMSLFVIFYRYQIFNFHFCFSKESTVVFQSVSSSLISPILNSAKFALSIIVNRTTRYSKLEVPSSSMISYTVQNLTSFITAVSELKDDSNEIYAIWSNPQETIYSTNVSLQYLLLQINGLTKLIPNNLTTKEMSFFLKNFFHIYFSTYQPIDKLRLEVYKFVENLRDKQYKYSILFALICFSLEFVIILFILFFLIHSTKVERNKFCKIIVEVDDKSIISFQESLRDDYIAKHNQTSKDKIIGKSSDDIEIINDETFSFPSTSTVIDEKELKLAEKRQKSTKLIIFSFLFLFLLICAFIFDIFSSLKIINDSLRYNKSLDNLNVALINVSNSATECAAILACGIESEESKTFKKFLIQNSRHLDRNNIELFDDEINEIVDSIEKVYENVFSNLTKWFENGFQFDSYFECILDTALNISNPILFKIESYRFDRFEYYKQLKNKISTLFSIFVFSIYFTFSMYFIKKIIEYSSEFSFLKSLLLILPSPYLSTISNLISLFSQENNNEEKSVDSLNSRSRYILKQSLDSIIIIDSNKKIQDLNEATEILTGMKKDELIGREITKIINQEDNANIGIDDTVNNDSTDDRESVEFFRNLAGFNDQNVSVTNTKKFNLHLIKSNGSLIPISCTLINIKNYEEDESNQSLNSSNQSLSLSLSSQTEHNSSSYKLSSSISYSSLTKEEATPAFAMVLCDRTSFTEQEEELKNKKKQVEDLLDRVLPRVMAKKLQSGNQKLHSKIEKATIMFIGIVNILPWIRKHNPTEIMEQLDVICTMFDQNMANFPTLVKLKVINGTYMAAAGLFNDEFDKSGPVEAVEFALLCAQSIANKNSSTNKSIATASSPSKISAISSSTSSSAFNFPSIFPFSNLSMNISPGSVINKSSSGSSEVNVSPSASTVFKSKPPLPPLPPLQANQSSNSSSSSSPLNIKLMIGINTGPIIAGILGSDKPVFDVWGDAVNVSSRLETSCPCNHIQMSKETMQYLPRGEFDIKMRKGVYLKGKGYTNTYTISFEDIMNGEKVITIKDPNEDDE